MPGSGEVSRNQNQTLGLVENSSVWEEGELSGHLRVHTAKLKCLGSQSNIWIYIQTDNVYAFIQILFIVECGMDFQLIKIAHLSPLVPQGPLMDLVLALNMLF